MILPIFGQTDAARQPIGALCNQADPPANKDMSRRLTLTLLLLLAAGAIFTIPFLHAEAPAKTETAVTPSTTATNLLAPSSDDGQIAYVAARALEQNHFRRHSLDDDYSEQFFDRYIESLDPQRLHFTQEDLAGFASYRTNLDNLTFAKRLNSDTRPAYQIFNRMRQRMDQRVAYVNELLKSEQFTFNTDEQIIVNRKDEPAPRDLEEARHLWRQRLRSEYLGEKIAKYAAKKKTERDEAEAKTKKKPTAKPDEVTKVEKDTPKKTEAEEIVETLSRRYNRISHFYQEFDQDDVLEVYLTSLAHVYDPHTDYFNPRQAEDFSIGMNLSLFGIGAVLTSDQDGYCKIAELKPGPAFKSKKIKVGDRIVAVAQSNAPPVDVLEMKLSKIVQMVRGPRGTEVRLTIVSSDSTTDRQEVKLIRDEIKLDDQAAKAKVIDIPAGAGKTNRIGVIDLPSFYVPMDLNGPRKTEPGAEKATPHYTSTDVAKLLAKFKKENVQGVILDLRRNGGGSLEECVKLTGLFIKDGPVVQVRDRDNRIYIDEDRDPRVQYDGPLIVLTSRHSASASEILAGALQDYDRALIVGDLATHGKGTVQQLNPLRTWISEEAMTNDPGTLKITKAKFYRASGGSTQLKGVMSDIVLPSYLNHAKNIGEESIESALPYDRIESSRFDKLNFVEPFKEELLTRSSERVGKDREYDYVRQDIETFRRHQALNSISLNEKQRIKEWDEEDLRQRARTKERLASKSPNRITYDVSLQQAELPGLTVTTKTNVSVVNMSVVSIEGKTQVTKTLITTEDAETSEDAAPAIDPALEETQRILLDYIAMIARKGLAMKTR